MRVMKVENILYQQILIIINFMDGLKILMVLGKYIKMKKK